MKKWIVSDIYAAKYLGDIEFKDNKGEFQDFQLLTTMQRIIFGSSCNTGFIESGYIEREEGESLDETLQELYQDLQTYYNEGKEYTNRIVCNDRM